MSAERKRLCDCGKPATIKKGNAFVCAGCDRIEKQMYNSRNRTVIHDAKEVEERELAEAFSH